MSEAVTRIAEEIQNARHRRQPVQSGDFPVLNRENCYEVASAAHAIRNARELKSEGTQAMRPREIPFGRKMGFTNADLQKKYGIDSSIWGWMYRDDAWAGARDLQAANVLQLSEGDLKLQPKLEFEIAFRLRASPQTSMSDAELLNCIEYVQPAFEVVNSVFVDWKFTAAEATAYGALHDSFYGGKGVSVASLLENYHPNELIEAFGQIEVDLFNNGDLIDRGVSSNALGNPFYALRHLCSVLEEQHRAPLSPLETISTGTITAALPMNIGDNWRAQTRGATAEHIFGQQPDVDCLMLTVTDIG